MPRADSDAIAALDRALSERPGNARAWGMQALLLRKAAEYGDDADCAGFVGRCEAAARKALALDPAEPNAKAALAGLAPLFGRWGHARAELLDVLGTNPQHVPALHDLAVLEMATGRPSVATGIVERLLSEDRFAATFHYKRMYHLWTIGDLPPLEQVSAQALTLWPRHPAIWFARYWTLVFTGRADQAARMARQGETLPSVPAPAIHFLQRTAEIVAARDAGIADEDQLAAHSAVAIKVASSGPANAVAALMSLCAIDAIDEAFEVAYGYYLGRGASVTPLRWNAQDPSVTDQHRRVTQPLFIPSAGQMRASPRFMELCRDIGMTAYWEQSGITPDFKLKE
jgi:tetratricopeptide (TPR) repeat protein